MFATMSTNKARSTLTLRKKCKLIDIAKKNPQLSSRVLAARFGCGKTQFTCMRLLAQKNTILSKKESLLEQYESNVSKDCVLLSKRSRTCEFAEENESLYMWYSLATTHNICPTGPQLCEKTRLITDRLGVHTCSFNASNRWLDR